ncbi:helix-turn-helix domain-containing protein [Aeromonas caviae]|uniref:helix-turn-helix domain-containing protein n=1 Tax=Aeromonas caviae TaxID=648 RepID=UPI002B4A0279|nr:helix-turn-helix transcriptional regulator [Aeromonas caviae]
MLTPFGKTVRKMRIDLGITLKSMADSMGKTSSYLSAIETGKRAITDSILNEIIDVLAKNPSDAKELRDAAFESKDVLEFNLSGRSESARHAAIAFARSFEDLNDSDFVKLQELLKQK